MRSDEPVRPCGFSGHLRSAVDYKAKGPRIVRRLRNANGAFLAFSPVRLHRAASSVPSQPLLDRRALPQFRNRSQ